MQQSKRLFVLACMLLSVQGASLQAVSVYRTQDTQYRCPQDLNHVDKKELLFKMGGEAYSKGQYKQAKKYYLMAVEFGHVPAMLKLGYMYYEGKGIPKIPIFAAKYFNMAAKKGDAEAQEWVAYMYYNGKGVAQNYEKALHYYRMAAASGRVSALYNLARMYQMGQGTKKDIDRAVHYYHMAADRGYKMAEQVLAELVIRPK